jgi:glutamate-1-semialdehyde 2,1-aminomutase
MEARGSEIAAVIIEGVPANSGLLIQSPEYLRLLREQCDRYGALLIFDEVITGFRLGPNGAVEVYGVTPDLATYGKVIGGGMPVGAYGGRRELMDELSPLGPVYQAGTLSGNPVAMAAGVATLEQLLRDDGAAYERLEALGGRLANGLQQAFERAAVPWSVARLGSILWLSLQPGAPPRKFEDIADGAADTYAELHRALLARGISLAPSAYEVMFVSLAHDDTVIDETVAAFDDALQEIA